MQITIEVPDSVAVRAAEHGMTAEDYAELVLVDSLTADRTARPQQNIDRFLTEFPFQERSLPSLPDDAFSRENIYEDDRR